MLGVGIFALGGEFFARFNIISIYKCFYVVSTMLLYHMYSGWFVGGCILIQEM